MNTRPTQPRLVTFSTGAAGTERQIIADSISKSDAAWRAAVCLASRGDCSPLHTLTAIRSLTAAEVKALVITGVPVVPLVTPNA